MRSQTITHSNEDFATAAPGIEVRELDIAAATNGEYTLAVIRISPEGARVDALHRHDERFSLAYVLKGWLDVEFQALGVEHLGPGTVVPAFNAPTHREIDAGDDLELLLLVTQKPMCDGEAEHIVLLRKADAPAAVEEQACRDFGLETLSGGRISARALRAPGLLAQRDSSPDFHCAYIASGWLELDQGSASTQRLQAGAALVNQVDFGDRLRTCSDDLLVIEIETPAAQQL